MTDRADRVRRALLRRGVAADEIERAMDTGNVGLLAVDATAVPGRPHLTARDVAERSGAPVDLVGRLWRALGLPSVADDDVVFADVDVKALVMVRKLIERGMTEEEVTVHLARVVGSSMSRLADALISAQVGRRQSQEERLRYADAVLASRDNLLDQTEQLLDYTWRRHLQAAARRGMGIEATEEGVSVVALTVGFADLVGYTALSQQLSEEALAALIGRFEDLAYDVVAAAGGRVIKTIGDEVMYAAEDPAGAVDVALALSDAYADDELLSEVRVGLATGHVLAKDGDYYGPVVNLASRLVGVAYPGTVVVSADMREALADEPGIAWRPLRPRRLKDIGTVPVWALYRAGDPTPPGGVRQRFRPLRTILSEAGLPRVSRRGAGAGMEPAAGTGPAGGTDQAGGTDPAEADPAGGDGER